MSSNGYGAGGSGRHHGNTSEPYRPAYQTSLLPPQPPSYPTRRDQYGGGPSDYLPATSVATGYTVPSSAASIAGYRTYPSTTNDYQSSSTNGYQSNPSTRPYIPRAPRPPAPRVDEGATGLAALASASEATETYERRGVVASSSTSVPRGYHALQSSSSSSARVNGSRTQSTRHHLPPVTSNRVTTTYTTTTTTNNTSNDDTSYPIAPSPAYDPVAFERIIGLSADDEPSSSTPNVESEQTRAQRLGISPAMLMNNGESRLQALVKATEPGQLEAWQTETSGKKRKVRIVHDEADETEPMDVPRSLASSTRGRGGARVRKPRPKKGDLGWKPRPSRRGGSQRTGPEEATQEAAVEDESSPGPFNSLTAHLAAYSQRDKALQREEAGYGRIPDVDLEELLVRRRREAAEEEARREAMLPARNGGGMDIDLSGFGDIDAEIDEQADYEAQRQARIAHNNRIMAALGLGPVEEPEARREPEREPRSRIRPTIRRKREPRMSPDGTTFDPCISGRQRLAFVDIPHIFRSRRVQGLFRYCELPAVPENPTTESESELEEVVMEEAPVPQWGGPKVHYSQMAGDPCHQCRRKSTKAKMSCRNKACGLKYCITCVQRYNFPFEEYSRTFICPRCQGYCNCSACLRSSGLLKLLKLDENQDKLRMSLHAAKSAPNVQVYLEMMGAPKAPPMPLQELHRIRFIKKEEDIITPEIPDDILSELMSRRVQVEKVQGNKNASKKTKKTKKAIESQLPEGNDDSEAAGSSHDLVDSNHPAEIAPVQEPESSDLSDEEDVAYYDPQYGYQAAESRRPADANYQYAIANAWSVYQT